MCLIETTVASRVEKMLKNRFSDANIAVQKQATFRLSFSRARYLNIVGRCKNAETFFARLAPLRVRRTIKCQKIN